MPSKKPVTANCRYLDAKRRVCVPSSVLENAGIPVGCMLDFEVRNGCRRAAGRHSFKQN